MKNILIIEDDEKAALALTIRLKAHGYSTWIASDALNGLSMAMRNRPDLVLLDVGLPAGDGFALAAKLRRLPETKEARIIFLTASKDPELREKVMDLGAEGLIEKPYDSEDLLLMIDYAFGRPARGWRDQPRTAALAAEPEQNGRTVKKILLVEDDRKIAMGLGIRLKNAGYETLLAYDGLEGINAAVKNRPDLVLLDISMPAGDGFTVARRIQTAIPAPTPLIFLTASKQPEFRTRARELGAVGFFEKPFDAGQLLATIRKALTDSREPARSA